jgi:translocation and assembly module TamB
MTPRARRRLALGLGIMAALGIVVAAGGWWTFSTQRGARWGFERLGAILPGKLHVREMSGPLRSPLEVRHLTYRTERTEVTIDRLVIHWRLSTLLQRRLDIHRLHAENVRWLVGSSGDRPAERDSLASPLPDVDLPVSIVVREGVLDGLQITTPGRDSGLVIRHVSLSAQHLKDSLRVNRLAIRSRTLDLDFQGSALPRGSYPLALSGHWTWRRADGSVMAGDGTVVGTLDTLRVVQKLSQPFVGRANAVFYRVLRQMRFDGDLEYSSLVPRVALGAGWPEGVFHGRLNAGGDLGAYAVQGTYAGNHPAVGQANGAFHMQRVPDGWRIQQLSVRLPASGARLSAEGTMAAAPGTETRFDIDTRWRDLDWPLRGQPVVESPQGHAHFSGTPRSYGVRLEALLGGRNLPPGRWWLDGRGGGGRMSVRTVVADILGGRVTGTGSVAWKPRPSWRLAFQGRDIDPSAVWPQWPGTLAMTGHSEGSMTTSGPVGRMLVSHLEGMLRNQPLQGGGTLLAHGGGRYSLNEAAVQWGANRAEASGALGSHWDLQWRLDAPALGTALPQASGSLVAEGSIRGPGSGPRIVATATAESLHFGRTHADALRVQGDLDLSPAGAVTLDVAATDVDLGARSLDRFLLTARGTRARHELRAGATAQNDSLVAVLSGGLGRDAWQGQLTTLDLVKRETGNWSLASPAGLVASRQRMQLSDLVWRSDTARVTLQADWHVSGPWRIESQLDQVQLGLLAPLLPGEFRLHGPLAGRVLAERSAAGRLYADVDLTPGPGEILHLVPAGDWVATRFERGVLRVTTDPRGLNGQLALDLIGAGTVRATLTMPSYIGPGGAAASQPLAGTFNLHLTDLGLVQGLTPELDATAGRLDADLSLGGTLGNPSLGGQLLIQDGQADVPRLGLQLREIRAQATGTPAGRLALDGSLRSGPGRLEFTGTADLAERARPVARLNLTGQKVQAANTRDLSFLVSPALVVAVEGKKMDVTGELEVTDAEIDIDEGDPRAIRPSRDVVYSGGDTLSLAPMEVHSRVRIAAGDDVWVRGFGIDVRARGSVLATDEPGLPTLGTGELHVEEGTYRIYGQELAIERGRLVFGGGPIANPRLDARASRRAIDGVVAGFEVRGTLQQPDLRVFSDPTLGQSQALAYILFGRPVEKVSLAQGQFASTLATSLGLPGTSFLAHGLASGLGIESAQISSTGGAFENTSLLLGTHLSPRLYASYGVGLFDAGTSLRLRYLVSDRWTVEAESAEQNRVDFLYTVER